MLVFDLFAQSHFLQGPLFEAPAWMSGAPWLGLALAAVACGWRPARRPGVALLALLHYAATYVDGQAYSEADAWIWLMAIALVMIPDEGEVTRSWWAGALKLIGFLVYFFAGLQKATHPDWWSGEAMRNVYLDSVLMNPKYAFIAKSALLCQFFCLLTLFQRLVVSWGLLSRRPLVRKLSAGILAIMHYSYVITMNVGTFSWVGLTYLSPYFFPSADSPEQYYRLPPRRRGWSEAAVCVFVAILLLFPAIDFSGHFIPYGRQNPSSAVSPPGLLLNWGMFANIAPEILRPVYSVKTCSGKELADDDVYWSFGTSSDYFRRRGLLAAVQAELLTPQGGPGPLERRIFQAFPEPIATRRVQVLQARIGDLRQVHDTGPLPVSDCAAVPPASAAK